MTLDRLSYYQPIDTQSVNSAEASKPNPIEKLINKIEEIKIIPLQGKSIVIDLESMSYDSKQKIIRDLTYSDKTDLSSEDSDDPRERRTVKRFLSVEKRFRAEQSRQALLPARLIAGLRKHLSSK